MSNGATIEAEEENLRSTERYIDLVQEHTDYHNAKYGWLFVTPWRQRH